MSPRIILKNRGFVVVARARVWPTTESLTSADTLHHKHLPWDKNHILGARIKHKATKPQQPDHGFQGLCFRGVGLGTKLYEALPRNLAGSRFMTNLSVLPTSNGIFYKKDSKGVGVGAITE